MAHREFSHSNNPGFTCSESVLLLPFGRSSYLTELVDRYGGRKVELDDTTDRIIYHLEGVPSDITLLYSGMGGPATANALEMAAANGARRIVIFGACGGIDPAVGVGDLLIPTGGVRGEGTSDYYAPPSYPAAFDPILTTQLWQRTSRAFPRRCHRGVVYTTDAGYRQGPDLYETYRGLALGVECECATAAVVGAQLGLIMGALLFVTDNVTLSDKEDRQYRGLRDPRVRRGFDSGSEIVIEALHEITLDSRDRENTTK